MKKSGLFIISLMIFAGLMVFFATETQSQTEPEVITIEGRTGNVFSPDSVELARNTEYNITFIITDPVSDHNLRIDENGDVSEATLDDSEDILIGPENDVTAEKDTYSKLWTTPDSDTSVTYYCGFEGHYSSGMEGEFIIGEGEEAPGFELLFALSAVFLIAAVIPRMRKNQ